MTPVRTVTETFAVAGQIRPEDLPALSGRFRLLINNRPDGEDPNQPTHAEMQAAAEAAGLRYAFVPVSGLPNVDQVRATREAIAGAGGATLAFCRTGTRCIVTWALGEALAGRAVGELTTLGAQAGYDLGPPLQSLLPRMQA